MPNASRTVLDEIDQSFSPADVPVGISAVIGVFKRGPVNDPSTIVSGWPQFSKIFGGLVQGQDDSMIAKRALERGSQLRVVGIRHYTNPGDTATLSAVKSSPSTGKSVSLSTALIVANTLTITINATPVAQVFTGTSDNTINLLVAKINQQFVGIVAGAWYLGGNKILIVPATGVALVVTSAVTGGAGQAVVTVGSVSTFAIPAGGTAFSLTPKYPGQDYNNLLIAVLPASNGNANYFDVSIVHLVESNLNESYKNLTIIGTPTAPNSNYLQDIANGSQLVDVVYADLSAAAAPVRPVNTYLKYDTGSDGGAVNDADIAGDSGAKTGVFALDPYDDFRQLASVNSDSVAVIQALAAYTDNRQDCVAFHHIDNSYTTEAAVAAFRDSTLVDSSYSAFYAGGVTITDPFTNQDRDISEIGDVLGAAAYSDAKFGAWYSFAGPRRGTILNALGVVNNFGLNSNYAGRNLLANHQVNLAINKSGKLQISGNFTAQLDNSTLSFLNVRRMLLYLKAILAPIYDSYIEEPNDPTSWLSMYNEVKPVLQKLKTQRGIQDYSYQGDQFVTNIDQAVINDPTDVENGKYLANLFVIATVSLQQIQVNIILTDSGVSFEEVLSSVGSSNNQ